MIKENFLRHHDIIGGDLLSSPVLVVGCGAIGSWTSMALARLGFNNLTIVDMDKVDTVNLGAQCFTEEQAKNADYKTEATRKNANDYSGIAITGYADTIQNAQSRYEVLEKPTIIVLAVDSMEVRKWVFDHVTRFCPDVQYIIDSRMGAEFGIILNIDMKDKTRVQGYRTSLFTDGEAVELPCMAKATTYCALVMSGMVVNCVVRNLTGTGAYRHYIKLDLNQGVYNAF